MNFWRHNIYCLSMFIIIFFWGAMLHIFALYIFWGTELCIFFFYLFFFFGYVATYVFLMGIYFEKHRLNLGFTQI